MATVTPVTGLTARGVKVVKATFGLVSNNPWLISNPEFFTEAKEIQSLLTNVYSVDEIPFDGNLDAYVYMLDLPEAPLTIRTNEQEIWAAGPLSEMDRQVSDRRYSMFGNLGLFFKFAMATLERCYGIYSFHASALYVPEEHELIIVGGGAGAGKTVFLLGGLSRGYQIFSTEMTHFQFTSAGCVFYKGALWDNVRVGNFVHDFPKAAERLGLSLPDVKDVWGTKIPVYLAPVAPREDTIVNPKVTLLFPRIESGRERAIIGDLKDKRKLVKLLFDTASEKIGGTNLFYEAVTVDSQDHSDLMARRLATMQKFVSGEVFPIRRARTVFASAQNCMEAL